MARKTKQFFHYYIFIIPVTGRKTERSPWHALIYKNSTFICFGTLINPKVVITAMNCFNREIIEKVDYLNKFVIAVGKEHKAKYDARDKKAQLAAIKKICWPDGQQKIKTVIVLSNSSFIVTDYVQPVAIDWSLRFKKEINKTRPIEGLVRDVLYKYKTTSYVNYRSQHGTKTIQKLMKLKLNLYQLVYVLKKSQQT